MHILEDLEKRTKRKCKIIMYRELAIHKPFLQLTYHSILAIINNHTFLGKKLVNIL